MVQAAVTAMPLRAASLAAFLMRLRTVSSLMPRSVATLRVTV
jgi:hypothetical protein